MSEKRTVLKNRTVDRVKRRCVAMNLAPMVNDFLMLSMADYLAHTNSPTIKHTCCWTDCRRRKFKTGLSHKRGKGGRLEGETVMALGLGEITFQT